MTTEKCTYEISIKNDIAYCKTDLSKDSLVTIALDLFDASKNYIYQSEEDKKLFKNLAEFMVKYLDNTKEQIEYSVKMTMKVEKIVFEGDLIEKYEIFNCYAQTL